MVDQSVGLFEGFVENLTWWKVLILLFIVGFTINTFGKLFKKRDESASSDT